MRVQGRARQGFRGGAPESPPQRRRRTGASQRHRRSGTRPQDRMGRARGRGSGAPTRAMRHTGKAERAPRRRRPARPQRGRRAREGPTMRADARPERRKAAGKAEGGKQGRRRRSGERRPAPQKPGRRRASRATEGAGPGRKTGSDAPAEGATGPRGGQGGAPGRRRGLRGSRGQRLHPGRGAGRESLRHDRYRLPPARSGSGRRQGRSRTRPRRCRRDVRRTNGQAGTEEPSRPPARSQPPRQRRGANLCRPPVAEISAEVSSTEASGLLGFGTPGERASGSFSVENGRQPRQRSRAD